MKFPTRYICALASVLFVTPLLTFCGNHKAPHIPSLNITVVQAVEKTLPTTLNFVGQTHSLYDVKIQPRISGYLVSINYREGTSVKKGSSSFNSIRSLPHWR